MDLYAFFRSSTSFRLRIALAWKGLPYRVMPVSLPKMEHRSATYLARNPQGIVPMLVDDAGRAYTQSMATIELLDERHPEPPLLSADPDERWYVRAVSQAIGCEIHPLNNVRVLKYLRSDCGRDDAQVQAWYEHWIREGLTALEAFVLAEGRHGSFLLGDRFTMADVCLVPQIYNAQRFNCDLSAYPTLMRLFARADALPCVQQARPDRQPDAF